MLALAVRIGPRLGGRDEGGCAPQAAVVEDDQAEAQRPLHEVVTGEDLGIELGGRQGVQVELAG